MLLDKLSPIYKKILPKEVAQIELPEERFAQCSNCHHCHNQKNFRFATKCCDYHPRLPNYIIGAILSDTDANLTAGRERILTKIKNKRGVTPYGILAPLDYHQKFQANRKKKGQHSSQEEFTALKCPYLTTDGLCSIYKYRSDICPVFYCMSSSGAEGSKFWNLAYQYMLDIERKLTIYALQEIGYPITAIQTGPLSPIHFKIEDKSGAINEKNYQKLWKIWAGKEIEFYKICYNQIEQLTCKKIKELTGIESTIMAQKLSDLALKMHQTQIPDFLKLITIHPKYTTLSQEGKVILKTGKQLTLSPLNHMLLKKFNGTTSTLSITQQANLMKQQIVSLLYPLLKEGILEEVHMLKQD